MCFSSPKTRHRSRSRSSRPPIIPYPGGFGLSGAGGGIPQDNHHLPSYEETMGFDLPPSNPVHFHTHEHEGFPFPHQRGHHHGHHGHRSRRSRRGRGRGRAAPVGLGISFDGASSMPQTEIGEGIGESSDTASVPTRGARRTRGSGRAFGLRPGTDSHEGGNINQGSQAAGPFDSFGSSGFDTGGAASPVLDSTSSLPPGDVQFVFGSGGLPDAGGEFGEGVGGPANFATPLFGGLGHHAHHASYGYMGRGRGRGEYRGGMRGFGGGYGF